ncbi:hypothetical protein NHJ13051_004279 [Beauveria bassiana]
MNESPVLSVNPITLVSIESQGHIKIPALQQTVTKPAEKQSQAGERPSTIVKEITTEASSKSLEQQEQSKDTSNSIPISTPLQVALKPGQQPQSETSGNTPQTEPATTGLQNLARIEQNSKNYQTLQVSPVQNSKGCQTIRESPVHNSKGCQTLQESSSQNSKGCQTIRELPEQNIDDEYTASDALELLSEMKRFCTFPSVETSACARFIGDLATLVRYGALQGHTVQPDLRMCILGEWFRRFHSYGDKEWGSKRIMGRLAAELRDVWETTQQFARSASLRTNLVCNALPDSQFESQKDIELSQRNGLGLAKGCIERTIRSANLAVANLDALLPGRGSTNDMSSGLVYALDKLQEHLPAVTDEFFIEMRNNILSLAHCAQVDGAMRIREVRDVVMATKAALETLLQNLDVVE